MLGTGYDVNIGYISTFLITPSQVVTSENTKYLSREKRQCQFRDEIDDMVLFKDYSEINCNFECLLKSAYNECGCMPWDFPHLNSSMTICDRLGRDCFKQSIAIFDSKQKCKCKSDCTTTRYSYSVSQTKIDDKTAEILCSDIEYRLALLQGGAYKPKLIQDGKFLNMPPKFIERYEQIMHGKNPSKMERCIEKVKNLAIVNFQIGTKIMTRIKRTQRVTFADTLSNIGN